MAIKWSGVRREAGDTPEAQARRAELTRELVAAQEAYEAAVVTGAEVSAAVPDPAEATREVEG
jgi:hypothetical protein